MTKCEYCEKEVLYPFKCSFCGFYFCTDHRLPENHDCPNQPTRTPLGQWKAKKTTREKLLLKPVKTTSKKRTASEGEFYFIKEEELERKKPRKQKRAPRIRSKAKALAIFLISLIIVIIFILSWTNFFAQIFMPHFVDTKQVEMDILELINEERANRGLPTLLKDEALTTIALEWSKHLAETGNLTHGDFEDRIAQIGYSEYQCGEVIAMYGGWSSTLGREFVGMWLDSAGHREIMLTPLWGHMSVGVSKIGTTFYAVVDFRFS